MTRLLLVVLANVGSVLIAGQATWFDAPSKTDAAAGPMLRDALGSDWRGSWVTVSSGGRSVLVQLTDFCRCGGSRVVDLDDEAFGELAPLSRGVIAVELETGGPEPTLPATDTVP